MRRKSDVFLMSCDMGQAGRSCFFFFVREFVVMVDIFGVMCYNKDTLLWKGDKIMKKIYVNPMVEAVVVEISDILTLSNGNQLPDEESPF